MIDTNELRATAEGFRKSLPRMTPYLECVADELDALRTRVEGMQFLLEVSERNAESWKSAHDALLASRGGVPEAGTTLVFGRGAFIVTTGTFDGQHPAVFIDAAPMEGVVGEKAPSVPDGTSPLVRLLFPTREQAKAVADALAAAPSPSEESLGGVPNAITAELLEEIWRHGFYAEHAGQIDNCDDLIIARNEIESAAPSPSEESRGGVPYGYVLVRKEAIDWLNGEGEPEFVCPPEKYFRGKPTKYWWRSVFREKAGLVAAPSPEGQEAEPAEVTILPDGSAFAVVSTPLPENHWLYGDASKEDEHGCEPPPMPFRMAKGPSRSELQDKVRAAGEYALRASTSKGKEPDLDPDAVIKNLIVGLFGYHTEDGLSSNSWANPSPVPPLMGPAEGQAGEREYMDEIMRDDPELAEAIREEQEREAFDAWFSDEWQHPAAVERDAVGYKLASAQSAWTAWQAAWRAALAQQQGGGDAEDTARLEFLISNFAMVTTDHEEPGLWWLEYRRPNAVATMVQMSNHATPRAAIDAARGTTATQPAKEV